MLSLTTARRDELLQVYGKDPDPELRSRAHLILLLAGGSTWDIIEAMLFCSSRTPDRWRKRAVGEHWSKGSQEGYDLRWQIQGGRSPRTMVRVSPSIVANHPLDLPADRANVEEDRLAE